MFSSNINVSIFYYYIVYFINYTIRREEFKVSFFPGSQLQ